MHVMLMGAQGAGKGTQAQRVAPRLRLEHLSTGDLFRAAIAAESDMGRRIKAIYDRGELIPDELTLGLVEARLDDIARMRVQGAGPEGALFDGFPRNLAQAEGLDRTLKRRGERLVAVIEIVVPQPVLVERLAGRRVCTSCGAVYHINFNPPSRPGVCDRCGGDVVQREDDKPAPIARRLDLYFAQTEPLLTYYRDRGLLRSIDGNAPIDDVSEAIVSAVHAARGDVAAARRGE